MKNRLRVNDPGIDQSSPGPAIITNGPVGRNPDFPPDKSLPERDDVLPDATATPLLHTRKLTISQAAKMMSVGQTKVREWIKRSEIPVMLLDGKYLLLETDLEKFLQRRYGPVRKTEIKKPGLDPLPESVVNSNLLRKAG